MIRRLRLGFVVVICVVLQTTLFTHLRIDGVAPEVGLVAVLAVAYYDGAEAGAWFGFVMGLSIDLFLTTPLGLSALSYAITAYGVGVFQAGMVRRPPAIAPLLGGIGGFFGGLVFLSIGAVVGESGFLSLSSLKVGGDRGGLRRPDRTDRVPAGAAGGAPHAERSDLAGRRVTVAAPVSRAPCAQQWWVVAADERFLASCTGSTL